MVEINNNNLEDALSSNASGSVEPKGPQAPAMSKETEIGFHQGALNTLINERNELIKVIAQVEQVMQAHMKRLEELGIKIKTGKKE